MLWYALACVVGGFCVIGLLSVIGYAFIAWKFWRDSGA